jgi:hypothetical protein
MSLVTVNHFHDNLQISRLNLLNYYFLKMMYKKKATIKIDRNLIILTN